MRKYNLFMEKFWLVVAAAIFGFSIYRYFIGEWEMGDMLTGIIVALVTASLSYLRYYMRKSFEQNQDPNS